MKKVFSTFCIFCLTFFTAATTAAANPLFESEAVLNIQLRAPFEDLIKNAPDSTDPYPATLVVNEETPEVYAIELSARGNSRRNKKICDFPPLRVAFSEKPEDELVFGGQKRLKLVTHCKRQGSYQEYYLLEYTAYKLLNVITDESLRVRLAKIDYIDSEDEKVIITRYGFFIEDTDDAAERLGLKEIDVPDIDVTQIKKEAAARYALFQYMIGNLDWSMHNGPEGEDCCHNTKLIGLEGASSELIPVPYDFDYSGFVDAPYAYPPDTVRVRSVTTRRYRGFCIHNSELSGQIDAFRPASEDLYNVLDATPEMGSRTHSKAKRYLDSFFHSIRDDEAIEKQLIKYCR